MMAQQVGVFSKVVQEGSLRLKEYSQGLHNFLDVNGHKAGQDTRAKILRSSLILIAQKHTTNISVREIAQHAGVNIASVNYHFRSKDLMLEDLFSQVIKGFDRLFFLLESQYLSAENCLIRWADRFMRYLLLYPGALIIVRDSPKWKKITEEVEAALERLQKRLDPLLIQLCEENGIVQKISEEELGLRRSILLGSLLQPMYPLTPAFDLRSRLRVEQFRRTYIIQVVRQQKARLADVQAKDSPF
ncbi:TetR/AcrR family transcriptional regulator [Candidatus Haliotispira prima]|uniref:TetR/AcrR family transcriptional regulator n=1 Tax=Candidatus Haliotispira prima TaxID=3034016 RepID=A0ABY8MIQ8_9SPIO|nr:TetR/AcrR family transcriptional regulator [Candidatus Haliotispira prima]